MDNQRQERVKRLFGEHMRSLRIEKGLSQEVLAAASGLDRTNTLEPLCGKAARWTGYAEVGDGGGFDVIGPDIIPALRAFSLLPPRLSVGHPLDEEGVMQHSPNAIADALGVGLATVQRDMDELTHVGKLKESKQQPAARQLLDRGPL